MTGQFRIELLSSVHDRAQFSSGSLPLDRYFREQATQDVKRRVATCFVAVSIETGYASVALSDLAPEIAGKLPRYPVVPVVLLGRLAVAREFQGMGLGGVLLANALLCVARVEVGIFAMLVDAKDEAAERFYERYGFVLLSGEGRRMCLPIAAAIRKLNQV